MGLGEADLLDDGGGGVGKAVAASEPCSICLDMVMDNGDRSWAKLQCGHKFHLDCIGSAFNVKGAMQCPNCRKIEKGQWLYANGSRPLPDFSMDDWAQDDDLYDLSYSEMSFGFGGWCPYGGLTRSFEEGDFPSSAYPELIGPHAFFAEHTPVSSTTHPCPYFAFVGPPMHSSSSTSSGNVSDGSSFSNQWNGPSIPSEVPGSYAFTSMDVNYHNWDHSPPFATNGRIGSADQASIPTATHRTARNNSDIPRPGMHPFIVGHSSASRAPSSVTSSVLPPYPGAVSRPRDRTPSVQAYFQHSTSAAPMGRTSLVSTGRRSSSHRGMTQVPPIASPPDQYYFVSSSSSGRTYQEAENPLRERFNVWEVDQQQSYPLSQVDRDPIWRPFPPQAGGSDNRSGSFRQRHGSERMPSQNRS